MRKSSCCRQLRRSWAACASPWPSQDVFARYGIDRPQYLSNFEFSVSRGRGWQGHDQGHVEPLGHRAVRDVAGRSGLGARPPGSRIHRAARSAGVHAVADEAPAPVTTPQSATTAEGRIERRPTPAPEPAPAPAATPRADAAPTPAPAPAPTAQRTEEPPFDQQVIASPGSEYTVQRNDTLSKIAAAANPGSRRVINRTMIAVFRANPQAFSGTTSIACALAACCAFLSCPRSKRSPTDEAGAEVSRQTAEWSGGVVADTTPESDRLRLVTPAGNADAADAPRRHLRDSGSAQPAATAGRAEHAGSSTRSRPTLAWRRFSRTSSRRPPSRRSKQRRRRPKLRLRREQRRRPKSPSLRLQKLRRRTPPAAAAAGSRRADAGRTSRPVLVGGDRARPAGRGRCDGGVHPPPSRERERRFVRFAGSPLAFEPPSERPRARARRRRARVVAPMRSSSKARTTPAWSRPTSTTMTSMSRRRRRVANRPGPWLRARRGCGAVAARAVEDTMSSESAVRFDQQDALAEADFHMAYGLYDQAADLVKIAIDREPARRDLKLKLLEIYFVWGNKDLFLDTARDLYETRDRQLPVSGTRSSSWASRSPPRKRCSRARAVTSTWSTSTSKAARTASTWICSPSLAAASARAWIWNSRAASAAARTATQVASDLDFLLDERKRRRHARTAHARSRCRWPAPRKRRPSNRR